METNTLKDSEATTSIGSTPEINKGLKQAVSNFKLLLGLGVSMNSLCDCEKKRLFTFMKNKPSLHCVKCGKHLDTMIFKTNKHCVKCGKVRFVIEDICEETTTYKYTSNQIGLFKACLVFLFDKHTRFLHKFGIDKATDDSLDNLQLVP